MPPPNALRECSCRSLPLLTSRSEEEPLGAAPFLVLAVFAVILGGIHLMARDWGWLAGFIMVTLELLWLGILGFVISEARAQRRHGLVFVRRDAETSRQGGVLGLTIGPARSLAGLQKVEVRLRCIEAFMEEREATAQGGQTITESVRICYVVWEDREQAIRSPPEGEARVRFDLPSVETLAAPSEGCLERYWEIEVVRHGRATGPQFRVLVYS